MHAKPRIEDTVRKEGRSTVGLGIRKNGPKDTEDRGFCLRQILWFDRRVRAVRVSNRGVSETGCDGYRVRVRPRKGRVLCDGHDPGCIRYRYRHR